MCLQSLASLEPVLRVMRFPLEVSTSIGDLFNDLVGVCPEERSVTRTQSAKGKVLYWMEVAWHCGSLEH